MSATERFETIAFARQLIDIDSTTGHEGPAARALAQALDARGWRVTLQPVSGDRVNVFAVAGDRDAAAPIVVLSTHIDCVPPFFPSRVEGDRLFGRGACDAKGILAAQVAAAERLRAAGERRVGLLFVVGEERGSDGAIAANALAPASCRYLINGEPTDNRLAAATRGVFRVTLRATGRAAHSSRPDLGVSAVDALLDVLQDLRAAAWPVDAVLGETHFNIGVIDGGVAPNVIAPSARAELLFRSVGDHRAIQAVLAPIIDAHARRAATRAASVACDVVLEVPAVTLKTLPGFETPVFAFTTDIPFLANWGTPLLVGPGSIEQAHTADESVSIAELHAATELYEDLARALLANH